MMDCKQELKELANNGYRITIIKEMQRRAKAMMRGKLLNFIVAKAKNHDLKGFSITTYHFKKCSAKKGEHLVSKYEVMDV